MRSASSDYKSCSLEEAKRALPLGRETGHGPTQAEQDDDLGTHGKSETPPAYDAEQGTFSMTEPESQECDLKAELLIRSQLDTELAGTLQRATATEAR